MGFFEQIKEQWLQKDKERLELDRIFTSDWSVTNFEIQRHYQKEPIIIHQNNSPEPWFNVCPRNQAHNSKFNCLFKTKDRLYVINLDRKTLLVNNNSVTYFDRFVTEPIPKEIKQLIRSRETQQVLIE